VTQALDISEWYHVQSDWSKVTGILNHLYTGYSHFTCSWNIITIMEAVMRQVSLVDDEIEKTMKTLNELEKKRLTLMKKVKRLSTSLQMTSDFAKRKVRQTLIVI